MSRLAPNIRSMVACLAVVGCLALSMARSSAAAVDCTMSNCTVDFLFVIDNSVSMGAHQAALSQAAEEMVAQLARDSIDWRVAVTYTDLRSGDVAGEGTTCAGTVGAGSHVLCPFTRDMAVFRDGTAGCAYANPGTCGGGAERGFSAARAALARLGTGTGCEVVRGGECSLRPGANLVLVFVTDTGEQTTSGPSPGDDSSVATWATFFASQGVEVIHGINCPIDPTPANPAPCGDKDVAAADYQRYRQIIRASLGVEGSILDSDFSNTIRLIINAPQNTGTTTTTSTPSSTTTTSVRTTTSTIATTSTTPPIGGATTTSTTMPVGGSTTTTTMPPGSATTTSTTTPAAGATTTTLPTSAPACVPGDDARCDDGDACTRDTCSDASQCRHELVRGFDAITCKLPPAACDGLPARGLRRLRRAERLIEGARASSLGLGKTRRLLSQAARSIKAASVIAGRRAHKGKLSADCASELRRLFLATERVTP
jgi:hypothetical protein